MDTNLTTMSRDAVTAATRHALAHGNPSVEPRIFFTHCSRSQTTLSVRW